MNSEIKGDLDAIEILQNLADAEINRRHGIWETITGRWIRRAYIVHNAAGYLLRRYTAR